MACRTMHRRVALCQYIISLFNKAESKNVYLQKKNIFNTILRPLETAYNEYMLINTNITPYHIYRKRYYKYAKEVTKVLHTILKSYTRCIYSISYYEYINSSIQQITTQLIKNMHALNEKHEILSALQHKYINRSNMLYMVTINHKNSIRRATKRYLKFCIKLWKNAFHWWMLLYNTNGSCICSFHFF